LLDYAEYKQFAIKNGYKFIVIMKDLEDLDIFPIYMKTYKELQRHKDNLISESKAKIIEIITL